MQKLTTQDLFTIADSTFTACKKIMQAKNADYSGGTGDPLANFRESVCFNVRPEIGVLIRSMDKFKRIQSFVEKGQLLVKDEPVEDAIQDVINYMILLKALIHEQKQEAQVRGKIRRPVTKPKRKR